MSVSPLSMLPVEVHQRVRQMLGEDVTGSEYWGDAEISQYVSDAYIEAARRTKALHIIESVATTADQAEYNLSDSVGQIYRVEYDGYKIYNTTKWELDRFDYDWENLSGYVSSYIICNQDNRTIRLYKAPTAGGGLTVSGGEYGVIESISDGVNTYMFDTEYGEVVDTSGTNWDANFVGEYGLAIITGGTDNNFYVWAIKHPGSWGLIRNNAVENFSEQMEFPHWSALGVAFRAAAKALDKSGEQGDMETATAYNTIAMDYESLLKGIVANPTPDRLTRMGRSRRNRRRPAVWERLIEDT